MPAINLCLHLFVAAATVVIYGTARLVHEISAEWQREREWDEEHKPFERSRGVWAWNLDA